MPGHLPDRKRLAQAGQIVRLRRKEMRMTQHQLARKSQLSRSTVEAIEGGHNGSITTLALLSKAIGVDLLALAAVDLRTAKERKRDERRADRDHRRKQMERERQARAEAQERALLHHLLSKYPDVVARRAS